MVIFHSYLHTFILGDDSRSDIPSTNICRIINVDKVCTRKNIRDAFPRKAVTRNSLASFH